MEETKLTETEADPTAALNPEFTSFDTEYECPSDDFAPVPDGSFCPYGLVHDCPKSERPVRRGWLDIITCIVQETACALVFANVIICACQLIFSGELPQVSRDWLLVSAALLIGVAVGNEKGDS